MFPIIEQIGHLQPAIEGIQEFGIYPNSNGTTVICYAIADKNTFLGADQEFKRECRGITFGPDGKIVARAMHKFHNIGENEASQPHNIPWDDIVRVMIKEDGSMITPLLVNGEIVCKTKRSFESKEALAATQYLYRHPEKLEWVRAMVTSGFTPTFEWVSPESPIVLTHYKEPELILLQVRHMGSGVYSILLFETPSITENIPFKIVENKIDQFRDKNGIVSFDLLAKAARETRGEEGWVVQSSSGQMWKVKTDFYIANHHTLTFLRWRDILTAVRDGVADDIRAAFTMSGRDTGVIDAVEEYVRRTLETRNGRALLLKSTIVDAANSGATERDIALKFKSCDYFQEAMRLRRGQDIMELIRKKMFQDEVPRWSLSVIPANLLAKWDIPTSEFEDLALIKN